jgi:ABC-2 type transport system permease protein
MTELPMVAHQVRQEQRSFWRNPQAAFFTFLLPIALLGILGAVDNGPLPGHPGMRTVDGFVPGIIVFGLLAAAYGNLASSIAVLRDEGVLKRIRATPLRRSTYLAGHVASSLVISAALSAVTIAAGWILFGVHLQARAVPGFALTLVVGAACLCALGLAVSGFIPNAQAAAPITNASYVPLAMVSGVFYPMHGVPSWLDFVVGLFPVRRLVDALRAGFDPAHAAPIIRPSDLGVIAVWLVAGALIAHHSFRWDAHRRTA